MGALGFCSFTNGSWCTVKAEAAWSAQSFLYSRDITADNIHLRAGHLRGKEAEGERKIL